MRLLDLTVTALEPAADSVLLLTLERDEPLPPWQPGDHVSVQLADGLTRQYSLCGDPADASWSIAVRREEGGRGGSEFVHTQIQTGDRLRVSGPFANFVFEDALEYLFVAGGIGITPLLPMIAEARRRGRSWRCVYLGRDQGAMPFFDELVAHGRSVQTHTTQGPPAPRYDLGGLLRSTAPETLVYCCGPESLLATAEATVPSDRLRVERFSPKTVEASESTSFDVELARSGVTLTVPANRSILEVLVENDADVIFSCEEGTCGTCEVTVLGGRPLHLDSVLTEAERAVGNCMLPCVSRSRSARLVLDV